MAVERTFSMIKPDATKQQPHRQDHRQARGGRAPRRRLEAGVDEPPAGRGLLRRPQGRPFFDELCDFMSSGPTVVQVLEGENAILKNREVMGATDPAKAAAGTIRKEFADSIGENSVHGSDAPETAREEIAYWFAETEIVG